MTDTRSQTPVPDSTRVPARRPDGQGDSEPSSAVPVILAVVGLFAAAMIWDFLPAVLIIAGILVMVFFHELGHYLTAKWAGMKVTEFFIGFGPRLWSFRKGETEYGFKPIPAGAYVKIIGMHNLEEVDPEDEPRTYRQQPYWRRLSVAVAGSAMHFLMALLLLFLIYAAIGVQNDDSRRWTVDGVSADSPAEEAGLRPGDRLLAIGGDEVTTFDSVRELVGDRGGEEVTIRYERDGEVVEREVTLASRNPAGEQVGFLGVGPEFPEERLNPFEATGRAFGDFGRVTWESGKALVSFFTPAHLGEYADKVSSPGTETEPSDSGGSAEISEDDQNRFLSPIGAVRIGTRLSESGIAGYFLFFVMINIFVGIFNLVPLLPLDGGHVAIATYEKIRSSISGRRYYVDVAKLMPITYGVVLLLATIGITALYLDVVDPVQLP